MDFLKSSLPSSESQVLFSWELSPPKRILVDSSKRANCRWCGPPIGWIKYNFDGAEKGNPSLAGEGGLCRNLEGAILGAFAEPLGS
eukprot:Gb_31409 [translate_table: standard]